MKLWYNSNPLNYHLGFMRKAMWKGGDIKKIGRKILGASEKIIGKTATKALGTAAGFALGGPAGAVLGLGAAGSQRGQQFARRNIIRPLEAAFQPKKFAGTGAGTAATMGWGAVGAPFGVGPLLATGYGAQAGRAHGGGTRGMLSGGLKGLALGAGGAGLAGGLSGMAGAEPGLASRLAGGWQGAGEGLTGYKQQIPGFGQGGMFGPKPAVSEFAGVAAEPVGAAGTAGTSVYPDLNAIAGQLPTAGELALTYPGAGAIGPSATAAAPASQSIWSQLWGGAKNIGKAYLGQNIVSAGLRLASGAVPQAEPSMEARDMYGDIYAGITGEGGMTPTGRIGTEKLGEMAAGEGWTELDQNRYDMAASNLDEDLDKKLTEMEKMYAAYGALDSGQYREEVMRMRDEASNLKQQMLYEMQAAGMSRQMSAVAKAVDYDVNTVNQLFGIAGQIGADEIMRTNLKNQNYDQLRRDLNTLAYAAEGGGETKTDAEGNITDMAGRVLSEIMINKLAGSV